jgi:tellurite resistance protein
MPATLSYHEALIYTMVTMSAVDRTMDNKEIARIGSIVRNLPVFASFDPEKLVITAEQCARSLREENSLEDTLDLITASLPEDLYETAYALAVEVAAANLHVEQEELRFLQLLRDHFNLDKLIVAAIERGARARHRLAPAGS